MTVWLYQNIICIIAKINIMIVMQSGGGKEGGKEGGILQARAAIITIACLNHYAFFLSVSSTVNY